MSVAGPAAGARSDRSSSGAIGSILQDGRRLRIVPADVRGRYHRARNIVFAVLIGLWLALPWIRVGGAPAVLLDVQARQFFLFGATFNAQDAWLVFFLLSGAGFGLVYVTALAGRVWCAWACPQTVFLEGVFRKIERWIEGPREARLRRQGKGMTPGAILRKAAKHALFVLAALVVAHVVLAYFVPVRQLLTYVWGSPAAHLEAFGWMLVLTGAVYANFAWFREQACVVVCPYGRLQSVLLDDNSLVVGYDARRGEPRGKKGRTTGDCVDCKRCVVVCPTGIDIRNGLQLDCLACTACIDACDEVMDKLGRPRGLIRYDSTNGLAGRPRRVLRPRIYLYTGMLLVGGVVAWLATRTRTELEAAITRPAVAPYTLEAGTLRNVLDLHVVNKRGSRGALRLSVDAPPNVRVVIPMPRVELEAFGDAHVPLIAEMPQSEFYGDFPLRVRVEREGHDESVTVTVPFLGAKP